MENELHTREKFREHVFALSGGYCTLCSSPAVDAHHIIERGLWPDEGYYIHNGIPLCEVHHRLAERNVITPQYCRDVMGYRDILLPPQLDPFLDWDKWGNQLKEKYPDRKYIKYPHSRYFTFSPGIVVEEEDEDAELFDLKEFVNVPLVITVKMDGSNFTMNEEFVAARNGTDAEHVSFDMAKSIHAAKKHLIKYNEQLFGEWLYAKHSIYYTGDLKLNGLFQLFGVYDIITHEFKGWEYVQEAASRLGIVTVPVLEYGEVYDAEWKLQKRITELGEQVISQGHEGLVIRSKYSFHYSQFGLRLGKYVRKNHVTSSKHWKNQPMLRNEVK
jgi:hypothetical protein